MRTVIGVMGGAFVDEEVLHNAREIGRLIAEQEFVLLTGGRPAIGPLAAGIAGDVYKLLGEANYFASGIPITPANLVASQICCSR